MSNVLRIDLDWNIFPYNKIDTNHNYLKNNKGIYLWIIETSPPRIKYVGQTQISFYDRIAKHITMQISGQYTTPGGIDYSKDFKHYLQKLTTYTDMDSLVMDGIVVSYPPLVNIMDITNIRRIEKSLDYLAHITFAFADLSPHDKSTVEEIESIFITSLNNAYKRPDGRELKFPGQKSGNTVLGKISRTLTSAFIFNHRNGESLPPEVLTITNYNLR